MEILVSKQFKYDGETYNPGDKVDLPEDLGKDVINKGFGQKVEQGTIEPVEEPPEMGDKLPQPRKKPDLAEENRSRYP